MIEERIARFALRKSGSLSYREAGAGPALLCLHGIGSSSAGWLFQLESLSSQFRVIAWDAPGYGESAFLPAKDPQPKDYAQALHGLMERLLLKDITLVGNSLGGLMAGAYARAHPERVRRMVLISPSSGYGILQAAEKEEKVAARLRQLDELGPEGLAEKRSPILFGEKLTPQALELARWSQRRIHPPGFRQAVHCLASGNHFEDARRCRKPVLVVCGTQDTVTPEAGCKQVAMAYPGGEYRPLPGLGHISHIEDPALLAGIISESS